VTLDRLEALVAGSRALFLEPRTVFDVAIMGIAEQADGLLTVAYDSERVVLALMNQDGWDEDTAREWYEFNIAVAFVGPGTPVFIEPREDDLF
jgi:hypothetical protein